MQSFTVLMNSINACRHHFETSRKRLFLLPFHISLHLKFFAGTGHQPPEIASCLVNNTVNCCPSAVCMQATKNFSYERIKKAFNSILSKLRASSDTIQKCSLRVRPLEKSHVGRRQLTNIRSLW